MYSEKVMDHFQNPRNVGEIEDASGVGTVGNAKCGDIMRMFLDIDENGIIREAKFKTFGCGAAVATSSMATELVKGKTIQEALQVTNKAHFWQRKPSMQLCGIMRRRTTSPLKACRSPRTISVRAKKRKTIKIYEEKSSGWHVRRCGFLRGSHVIKKTGL